MDIQAATDSDLDEAVHVLAAAFAGEEITGYLLQAGQHYPVRLTRFLSLLMRARIHLKMPVLLFKRDAGIAGVAMGYSTVRCPWPAELQEEWEDFERSVPGLADRIALYEKVSATFMPSEPHYYVGSIGVDPGARGLGVGKQLLAAFCDLSARDPLSKGVYLETAQSVNVPFYERAGFVETGRGALGTRSLWCMYRRHESSSVT
jgi:ribosomal protein S18 acetylase RimI-like enzyme